MIFYVILFVEVAKTMAQLKGVTVLLNLFVNFKGKGYFAEY